MRRLTLPVLGLLAYSLVLLTDAQGWSLSYEKDNLAPSVQHIQRTQPLAIGHGVPWQSTRCSGETDEYLSSDSDEGAAPIARLTVRAVAWTTDAAGANTSQQAPLPGLSLYHLYRVLLI